MLELTPRLSCRHLALLLSAVLALTGVVSCRSLDDRDGAPPPVPPVWLKEAALVERIQSQADRAAVDALIENVDYFVLNAAVAEGESRERAIAANVLLVKYYLHQLFYPVSFEKALHPADDPSFYRTLVQFERRAGLSVDGKFTVAEAARLEFLAGVEVEPEIRTVTGHTVVGDSEYLFARGTWALQGETIAAPVNLGEITCWRLDRRCEATTVNLQLPSGRRDDISVGMLLTSDRETYDVIEWHQAEMRARNTTACRQNTLTVNLATKQAHVVSTDLTAEGCPLVGPLSHPRVATLEDSDLIGQYFQSRRNALKGVSDSPRERIRSLLAKPSAR